MASRPSIVVIGSGIGGLFAANALLAQGLRVSVYEQVPALLVPRERLPDWPMDRWQMWAGPLKHFLVFPVRHGTMLNYVGFVPSDEEMKESWSARGEPDALRREFDVWDPLIGAVLKQVDQTFRWALYDREPLPTWTNGCLTLLGDAAHPMLPHPPRHGFGRKRHQEVNQLAGCRWILRPAAYAGGEADPGLQLRVAVFLRFGGTSGEP